MNMYIQYISVVLVMASGSASAAHLHVYAFQEAAETQKKSRFLT